MRARRALVRLVCVPAGWVFSCQPGFCRQASLDAVPGGLRAARSDSNGQLLYPMRAEDSAQVYRGARNPWQGLPEAAACSTTYTDFASMHGRATFPCSRRHYLLSFYIHSASFPVSADPQTARLVSLMLRSSSTTVLGQSRCRDGPLHSLQRRLQERPSNWGY